MHHGAHRSPRGCGIPQRCHRQGCLHPVIDRVADDPVRPRVLDRAHVELALVGPVLGDVGEPELVGAPSAELASHEVVVHGRTGPQAPATAAVQHRGDAVLAAQTLDAVLRCDDPAFGTQLVGDEAVAEDGIVGMDLTSGIDEVRVGPVAGAHGVGPPPVEALRRESQHPAGHLDGDPV